MKRYWFTCTPTRSILMGMIGMLLLSACNQPSLDQELDKIIAMGNALVDTTPRII